MVIHDDWIWGYHHDSGNPKISRYQPDSGRPGWPPLLVENRCHTIALSQTPHEQHRYGKSLGKHLGNDLKMLGFPHVIPLFRTSQIEKGACQNESVECSRGVIYNLSSSIIIYQWTMVSICFHSMLDHQFGYLESRHLQHQLNKVL